MQEAEMGEQRGGAQSPRTRWITIREGSDALTLHVLEWPGDGTPFVLLHGLASNATTWGAVGRALAAHGHRVVAVDQRGHGRSDKPDSGYEFATVADDLHLLMRELGIDAPVIVGQSWGGNVVLAYGARYPHGARRLIFVDGGFLDLQARPDATWERVAVELRPPPLTGTPRTMLADRIQAMHPDWTAEGIAATLGNFEQLADGTVRPWLTLERHMRILRALWEQRPGELYRQVIAPVTIAAAEDAHNPAWLEAKRAQVQAAAYSLSDVTIHWFTDTAHDIHVHRPDALAALLHEQR